MKDVCFVSCVFGDQRYLDQQDRLVESIDKVYPQVDQVVGLSWKNTLPEGAKLHSESLYGFKVYAIKYALKQGYTKIIWLDSACILQKPIDLWLKLAKKYGVVAIKDDNKLHRFIASRVTNDLTIDIDWHLVGGSLYVFDFETKLCQQIFNDWEITEKLGLFGNQHEQSIGLWNKHRHDESLMAVSIYGNGSEPVTAAQAKYNQGPDSIVTKQHFK